jgi:hypothetical protein
MSEITTIGLDLAKHVFQVHWRRHPAARRGRQKGAQARKASMINTTHSIHGIGAKVAEMSHWTTSA